MEEVGVAIIGAGVVGLAIAKGAVSRKCGVVMLERNSSFGQETSSRNSEVIHSGIYYPGGSLKARMCVEGRQLMYEACARNNIPCKKTGKIIVATEKDEVSSLEKLFAQGKDNGVDDLKIISRDEIRAIQPGIYALRGLYCPSTGIVDSQRLMKYLSDYSAGNGLIAAYNSEVTGITKVKGGYEISVKDREGITVIKARILVNSAGLDSDMVAGMAGFVVEKSGYKLHYCKGSYFRSSGKRSAAVKMLVYPVPRPKSAGLGIHVTVDLTGALRFGPDDEYLEGRKKDYSVCGRKRNGFYNSVKRFMPFIEEGDLDADTAGIRPKLQGPQEGFRDFVIQEESEKGFPGFINLIGIESPGLTASLAIGRHVNDIINRIA